MSRGRPQFQPTNEQRETCSILAAGQMSEEAIASVFGITRPTLRKHFSDELTQGAAERNAAVLEQLYRTAMDGNVAALRTWLARQADQQGEALGRKAQREADAAEAPPAEWADLLRPH